MKHLINKKLRIFFTSVFLLLLTLPVLAQSGGNYDLSWSTVDGGGEMSSGGTIILTGTIAQADAGVMSGGVYTLRGGFWLSAEAAPPPVFKLFLPVIMK